jgi:hypothetical protein
MDELDLRLRVERVWNEGNDYLLQESPSDPAGWLKTLAELAAECRAAGLDKLAHHIDGLHGRIAAQKRSDWQE